MGRDIPDGEMSLDGPRRLTNDWQLKSSRDYFQRLKKTMKEVANTMGADFLINPTWFLKRVITVHALGGCPMGRNEQEGVVDEYGEVFNHPNLYVADGAIMPGPVGPNPSLTIAALADRIADRIIEDAGERPTETREEPADATDEEEPVAAGPSRSNGAPAASPSTSTGSERRTPLHEEIVPFTATDDYECNLVHVWGEEPPTKGPVLVSHGAGVRANVFRAPVETNFAEYLVQQGYDVWLENWRASIDLEPNEWTLDKAARYDHPAAVETVVEETGADSIQAVIHCQGSTSFALSAAAGLVPQVRTIVSNAVSLHTVVPDWSVFKINYVVPFVDRFTDYLNPQWDAKTKSVPGRLLYYLTELTHHECDNAVCRQVSFYYGSGFPALWSHENLNAETHEWLRQEFANVPLSFYRQIKDCIQAGHLVSTGTVENIPADITTQPPQTDARFALFAGEDNLCFLPESQVNTHDFLDQHRPGYDSLHVVPGYGHLDMFFGKNAARDVYPQMVDELDKDNP
jgi:hypothetical protein